MLKILYPLTVKNFMAELLKHFDTNKSNEAVESLSKNLMKDVPKAAMVK